MLLPFNILPNSLRFFGMTDLFQAPKGTRDFLPKIMAVRRYIEDAWRRVSLRYGFQEVDGPTFESLDLYKVKSGEEIVSQLFAFTDRGGRELALRPEFTPTVARIVAQLGSGLPKPVKWFAIPRCYRAEQPQKGRLREFIQWNVDFIGDATISADRECLSVCAALLFELGLTAEDFTVSWNHRDLMAELLNGLGIRAEKLADTFYVLDRLQKLSVSERDRLLLAREFSPAEQELLRLFASEMDKPLAEQTELQQRLSAPSVRGAYEKILQLQNQLTLPELADNFKWDIGLVRGLAYYTGFVFEVADARGENRAVAGGGRYDKLIEIFGGKPAPAVGFGMGDVVLEILLTERGLMPERPMGGPDVFIVNASDDPDLTGLWASRLRRSTFDRAKRCIVERGLRVEYSYKTTKNIGKLLQEAAAADACYCLILAPDELGRNVVKWRNMQTRTETEWPISQAETLIRAACGGGVS